MKLKEVVDVLDEEPIFKLEDLELVNWMKNRYLCTYIDCINLIYPKGYKVNNYKVVSLSDEVLNLNENEFTDLLSSLDDIQKDIISKINISKGKLKTEKLKKIPNINYILDKMSKKNIINLKWEYKNHKNEKNLCYISLSIEADEVDDYLKKNKINLGAKQKEIVNFLKNNDRVEINDLIDILKASKQSILSLQNKNLIDIKLEDYYRNPENAYTLEQKEIYLNEEQKNACNKVISEMFDQNKKTYMLHGVTGSGKTEVYMEIIDYALSQGLDSIVLVPEIALTPQTITRFKNRFGDIVGVFHSQLSEGQKHDVYKAIKAGNIRILIGARSALFAPFNSLGVIIIDEFHETSYKSEKNPKFSAIEVAKFKLQDEIKQAIKNNHQVILFLNRRGYASFVSCRSCGYVFQCENCDISLTYHKGKNIGRCHYCGYEREIPKQCPECSSIYVKPFGVGTQKIEEELKVIFPELKVLRMDKDTTSKKGSLEEILNKFKNKEADILIGTQMLSKGLDFDNVTLVGILSADMILNFPDFKSFETTFQLITQVSGRAGRSDKEGKVVLQTYDTDHYSIRRAINYDFEGFYEDEIKIRKAFGYAPFNNMISVVVSGENENLVKKNIQNMYDSIIYLLKGRGITDFEFILGPNPCSISKINQNYRWQILFKDDNIEINLLKGIIKYICITKRDVVFSKEINISIDINPNSVL